MSDELFSRVDGKKTDKVLHETILRNRQADHGGPGDADRGHQAGDGIRS